MRSDRDRLLDILESIENINKYNVGNKDDFLKNDLIQSWMSQQVLIIGEAASRLSQSTLEKYPEIPWAEIIAMRNILVHAYFKVDPDEVWAVIQKDIPALENKIRKILESIA
jgi:uncharacterized protein with HEPN domain